MSLDFKGMFIYFGCTSLLWIFGKSLSLEVQLLVVALLVISWITVSVYNRKQKKWRWPGASGNNLVQSLLVLVLGGIFLFVTSSLLSSTNATAWYLGVCGLIVFNILHYLQFVDLSEQDFQDKCDGKVHSVLKNRPEVSATKANNWKNTVKIIHNIFFILVWLEFMTFLYYFNVTYNNGSPVPTVYQTEALTQHGRTMYITTSEKTLVDILQVCGFIGMPRALISGFLLQKMGIKVFSGNNRKLKISNLKRHKSG
jgi:hypothetical protein